MSAAGPVVIRPHRVGDDVFGLISPIQRQEFGLPVTAADQPDLADVDGFYRRGRGEFWVAVEPDGAGGQGGGERVVGSIALIDLSVFGGGVLGGGTDENGRAQGAVRKMFVAADRRGRESGLAQRLLDMLTAHARAGGMTRLLLGTTEKFLAAHRFYERNGFELIDAAALPPAFPRMAVDMRFYGKDL